MKKVKRVFFCVFLISFLFLGSYVLFEEFSNYSATFKKLNEDPSLLIPIHLTFFVVFSILFNIKKFDEFINFKSNIYKILRIGDLIFSISFVLLMISGFYYLYENFKSINPNLNFISIRVSVITAILTLNILLIIDNLKFHKERKSILNSDSLIDDIGN